MLRFDHVAWQHLLQALTPEEEKKNILNKNVLHLHQFCKVKYMHSQCTVKEHHCIVSDSSLVNHHCSNIVDINHEISRQHSHSCITR